MDMDMNAMKAEIGGAFAVAWLVIGIGMEWDLPAAVLMAAVWMAFSGAHVPLEIRTVTGCLMACDY